MKLLAARGPWSVHNVNLEQRFLFSLRPHIIVPILAFQNLIDHRSSQRQGSETRRKAISRGPQTINNR